MEPWIVAFASMPPAPNFALNPQAKRDEEELLIRDLRYSSKQWRHVEDSRP